MVSPIISAAELDELRADAESMMQDTFTAYAPGWVTVDGLQVETEGAPIGTTPGKVARPGTGDGAVTTESVGGVEREVLKGGLHIPVNQFLDATGRCLLKRGHILRCDTAGPRSDPAIRGRRYWVAKVPAFSNGTARRLDVVEVP